MRRDQRSDEAKAWRRLYDLAVWKRARKAQLTRQSICERCEAKGFVVLANTVNHRTPHKGDMRLFTDPNNHQSLCKDCHDGPVQSDERTGRATERVGYARTVSASGWPTDPRHRANQRR